MRNSTASTAGAATGAASRGGASLAGAGLEPCAQGSRKARARLALRPQGSRKAPPRALRATLSVTFFFFQVNHGSQLAHRTYRNSVAGCLLLFASFLLGLLLALNLCLSAARAASMYSSRCIHPPKRRPCGCTGAHTPSQGGRWWAPLRKDPGSQPVAPAQLQLGPPWRFAL